MILESAALVDPARYDVRTAVRDIAILRTLRCSFHRHVMLREVRPLQTLVHATLLINGRLCAPACGHSLFADRTPTPLGPKRIQAPRDIFKCGLGGLGRIWLNPMLGRLARHVHILGHHTKEWQQRTLHRIHLREQHCRSGTDAASLRNCLLR